MTGGELWALVRERWPWIAAVVLVIAFAAFGMAHLIDDILMLLAQWAHPGNRP